MSQIAGAESNDSTLNAIHPYLASNILLDKLQVTRYCTNRNK
jgi:hypothetical protein